ncbi:MAG: hypothetical protein JRJ59_09690 [Deltaproteobacteria bacterium]|nr:hypothetical protein [Deltaproteobacteria bacterium]
MYDRTVAFAQQARSDHAPMVILGLQAPGGRRLYARHTPTQEQTGFKTAVYADGTWLADGSATAGEGSEPLLARRRDAQQFGQVKESLTARSAEPLGILTGSRTSDMEVVLGNELLPNGQRHFSAVAAVEGLVGDWAQVEVTYPGLSPRDALRRFSGRVRRVEVTREKVVMRLRAV